MRGHQGQHLTEYALTIGVVVTTLAAMQTYVRRGVQARMRTVADINRAAPQYEPYYAEAPGGSSNVTTESHTQVRSGGTYRITPNRVSGGALTEITPKRLKNGNITYQVEWPPLP